MMPELGISCGGGGRYDKMVGRFTGKDVPACDGTQVLVARMNKNKKFQKEQLTAQGYEEFKQFYKDELKK